MEFSIFQIGLVAIGLLNLFVSIYIIRRDDLENFQKFAQTLIVWIIPLLGATALWMFHYNSDNPKPTKRRIVGGGPVDSSGVSQGGSPD